MARIIRNYEDLTTEEKKEEGSCRFCSEGLGKHQVMDEDKKERFFLCDKHLALYDEASDTIGKVIEIPVEPTVEQVVSEHPMDQE